MDSVKQSIFQYCSIQLQVLKDREDKLRKEILDCKIQKEFLISMIEEINGEDKIEL